MNNYEIYKAFYEDCLNMPKSGNQLDYIKARLFDAEKKIKESVPFQDYCLTTTPYPPLEREIFTADLSSVVFPLRVNELTIGGHIIKWDRPKTISSFCELQTIMNQQSDIHFTMGCNRSLKYDGYCSIVLTINKSEFQFKMKEK